ncbi:MBL fold metallo-hydrolase [Bdellovibrio bacteriovorus]|uniref:Beta-lactamase-like protein n=1 Tax=Bdellovibrio bacteriovorus str. Tiberius TaxID=1069642 RepID=K7Z097_BDEBC|nr:MBL fold metallo-hydrolase [Bdellovibrio bacteriovorus]AFY02420.1 beta-lactamase-like protein [Bdellovibrio bacteriovorus str. Tiberius]
MKIRQIRNATVLLDYGFAKILVDPMLARQGSIPSLKYLTMNRRRNPLVELPAGTDEVLETVTHVLITHCQKGHFDHLDRAGARWIRRNSIPILCSEDDTSYLDKYRLPATSLKKNTDNPFLQGTITLIPCLHGRGLVGAMMAHGYGYILKFPNQPTVYVVGDSTLSPPVKEALKTHQPDIVIMPGGGAQFDIGGEIIMSEQDIGPVSELFGGTILVNHLEALDHCPTSRQQVYDIRKKLNIENRVLAPLDGEELTFPQNTSNME